MNWSVNFLITVFKPGPAGEHYSCLFTRGWRRH